MARRTFFSFHYNEDVHRAWNVRNAWVTQERESAGFFDSSAFERAKRQNPEALKEFLTDQLKGSSVTCVLIGGETWERPWVRYEIIRSMQQTKGLLGVRVHGISNLDQEQGSWGYNPFDYLRTEKVGETVYWQQNMNGVWTDYFEVPSISKDELPWNLGADKYYLLSGLFPVYDWNSQDGRNNIGKWIETAARTAGR